MGLHAFAAAGLSVALLLLALAEAQSTQRSGKRAGKKKDEAISAAWLLPDLQPVPSAKELAGKFPDADAVLVLDAIQHEWSQDHQLTRVQRRVRLLTDRGAREHARIEIFLPETAGPWRALEGEARLVEESGEVTDLRPPRTEAVDGGLLISMTAGGAAAGDLLELNQLLTNARPSFPPFTVQGPLPVLESRLIVVPPPIVTVRAYGFAMEAGSLEPTPFQHGGFKAAGWRLASVPPIAGGELAPPLESVSMRLLLAVDTHPDLETGKATELDWPGWGAWTAAAVAAWAEPERVKSLAAELGTAATPQAVLPALRSRLKVSRTAPWPTHDSAGAALDAGSGSSADLALLAAAVLQQVGVEDVELVATRAAARGPVGAAAPVDGNFAELLVRAGGSWLDPAPGGEAGALPVRFLGTLHAPLTAGLSAPLSFPAATAAGNRLEREAHLSLDGAGRLSGSSTWSWSPVAAALTGERPLSQERAVDLPNWGQREGDSLEYGALPWRVLQELDLSGEPPQGVLWLGLPRTVVDVISVDLPDGVTSAKLSAPASIDAGPAGSYERTVKPDGRTVTVTRTFRLDLTRFGPEEAGALFTWLRRIQAAERATTRLTLN